MNLLQETIEDITLSGHSVEDIIFIGSDRSAYSCTWEEFKELADNEYSSGFGAQEVASDLIIAFSDGSKMWRHEYDGSENWSYSSPFEAPENTLPIKNLFVTGTQVGWCDLEEMNKP